MVAISPDQKVDTSRAEAQIRAALLRQQSGKALPAPKSWQPGEAWPPNYDAVLAWRQNMLARFELNPKLVKGAKKHYRKNPVDFINHWCDTYDPRNVGTGVPTRMPFIMFKRQEELCEFVLACLEGESPGLVEKSRDMGATWVCLALSVWMWLFWPGVAIGWGSRTQVQVDRIGDPSSLFEKMRMLIGWLPKQFVPELGKDDLKQYACINPVNGSTIMGEIGDNIGRGGRTRVTFVDEAAHLERPELVEASLSENTRVRIDLSSVSGPGTVFHRTRESGVEWAPGNPAVKGTTNVFVMDWSEHPAKTEAWHEGRKKYFASKGLPHVFAREIERDYTAAVEGVIIPGDWVRAAIDAHIALGFDDSGGWKGGLDVADEGLDRNALALGKGSILKYLEEWGDRDTGQTARKAVDACLSVAGLQLPRDEDAGRVVQDWEREVVELMYDSIGVGAGVKAETNRLRSENLMPLGLNLTPWNAAAAVLFPNERVIQDENGKDDKASPTNKSFYANLKAQAWWNLRLRFQRTYQAVKEGIEFDPDLLISIPSDLPLLRKLQKELSQATVKKNSQLKLLVDKTPDGASSPNLADAVVMAYWPWVPPQPGRTSFSAPVIVGG